jgi:hypothetical protein
MGAILETKGLSCGLAGLPVPVIPLYHPSYLLRQGTSDRARDLLRDTVMRLKHALELGAGESRSA